MKPKKKRNNKKKRCDEELNSIRCVDIIENSENCPLVVMGTS